MNELLSITENLGLMGVPVPKVLSGAIDLLRQKSEEQKVYQMPRKQKAKREQLIKRENEKIEIRFLFDDLIAEMTEKIEREEKEDVAV